MPKPNKEKTHTQSNADKFLAAIASEKNTHSPRARRRKMKRALDKFSRNEKTNL